MKSAAKRKPGKEPKLRKPAKRPELTVVPLNLAPPPWVKVTQTAVAKSRRGQVPVIFTFPEHPPGVIPKGADLANDQALNEVNAWAGNQVGAAGWFGGQTWLGYTYLAELAQQPEYRRISEVLATEATRKWIKLQAVNDAESKSDRMSQLDAELERLDVQGVFCKLVELDGFFGRSHLYIDTGDTDNPDELQTPIGDGRNTVSLNKFAGRRGFIKAFRPVEPIWVYPTKYNSINPLSPDWYTPTSWYVQGTQIHGSRLLTFIGREVPDILKPTYSFGGLSLSQMAKPYVDNWLRTRQAVADLVWSFSVRGLKTNLAALMAQDGDDLYRRAELFANMQNNQGLMLLDKDSEDFFNIQTGLGSLNDLQAQAQEHMASVTGTPIVKLLGIQPAGLNASSQGELTVWYDWVEAFQEKFIHSALTSVINFVMLSLWGEVDPEITFVFESLRALTRLEESTVRKQEADTDVELIGAGVLSPLDSRRRLASDPESPYDGLDIDDLPQAPGGGAGGPGGPLGGLGGPSRPDMGPRQERLDRARDPPDRRPPDPERDDRARDPADRARDPRPRAANDLAQDDWNESAHPRGQPENAGEFAKAPGGGSKPKEAPQPAGAPEASGPVTTPTGGGPAAAPMAPQPPPVSAPAPAATHVRLGEEFTSPNLGELDFAGATAALASPRHDLFVHAADDIDRAFGIQGKEASVIGAWSDGAENSTMVAAPDTTLETLRVTAALKGLVGRQKAVLLFQEGEGSDRLYQFHMSGELASIHKRLLDGGLENHTLAPKAGGADVIVVGFGGDPATAAAVQAITNEEVTYRDGAAEFIGTEKHDGTDAEQRADAVAAYERVLGRASEESQRLAAGLRDRWGERLLETEGLKHPPLKGLSPVANPATISSRRITGKTASENSEETYAQANLAAMEATPKAFSSNMALLKNPAMYPYFKPGELTGKRAEDTAEAVKAHLVDNLVYLAKHAPPAMQQFSTKWYDAEHALAEKQAARYKLPIAAVVGAYAALSPQKDWDMNVYLGDAVLDAYETQQDHPWDDKMAATGKAMATTATLKAVEADVEGKTLRQLSDPVDKAFWIKTYDMAHGQRTFHLFRPDGKEGPLAVSASGKPRDAIWGTVAQIANSVRAVESAGDRTKLSQAMGQGNKVRSFYDNILDPEHSDDVTVDTHAAAAALFDNLGGTTAPVMHAMGLTPEAAKHPKGWQAASNSAVTGMNGLYGLYADAYREAAKKLGIRPLELQSLTWEAHRMMFSNVPKGAEARVRDVWKRYHDDPAMTLDAAREAVVEAAGGFKQPSWANAA